MNQTISVIVPVYNVSQYLPACIESICSQTYSNLEIILIDDGSTDNSGILCDEYAKKDSRVKVIHQTNSGAASAKNAGLRAATGEYLAFVDSDDYLEVNAYEFMINKMQQHDVDIVRCGFKYVFVDRTEECIGHLSEEINTAEEFLKKFTSDWTCGLLWDKLYRRELFDGVFFEEGHKIDDEFFTYQGIMNASKILNIPRAVYYYRKRKSSVMSSEHSKKQLVMDKLAYSLERRKRVIERFPNLKNVYDDHYANFLILLSNDPYITIESLHQTKKQIKCFLKESILSSLDFRIKIYLFKILFTSNKYLLNHCRKVEEHIELEHFFE